MPHCISVPSVAKKIEGVINIMFYQPHEDGSVPLELKHRPYYKFQGGLLKMVHNVRLRNMKTGEVKEIYFERYIER